MHHLHLSSSTICIMYVHTWKLPLVLVDVNFYLPCIKNVYLAYFNAFGISFSRGIVMRMMCRIISICGLGILIVSAKHKLMVPACYLM